MAKRRTIHEMMDLYERYLELRDTYTVLEIAEILSVNTKTLHKWQNGSKPASQVIDKSGMVLYTAINSYVVLRYRSGQQYYARCLNCGDEAMHRSADVNANRMSRCKVCIAAALTPEEIALRAYKKAIATKERIEYENSEFSFAEIGEILGVPKLEVISLFKSAMYKIKKYIPDGSGI